MAMRVLGFWDKAGMLQRRVWHVCKGGSRGAFISSDAVVGLLHIAVVIQDQFLCGVNSACSASSVFDIDIEQLPLLVSIYLCKQMRAASAMLQVPCMPDLLTGSADVLLCARCAHRVL
eukprot:scaffold30345_cov21-Tisochrysis_lutea.AAC.2